MSLIKELPGRDKKIVHASLAITLDAVNNLSDALSSGITIFGTMYAQKAPDREHPLGHGRAEHLSAFLISIIILYAGLTALIESVKKMLFPKIPEYSRLSVIILFSAVTAKIFLGIYTIKAGKKLNSEALIASGKDALSDVFISASTIAAAFIFIFFHISIEAYLGAVISLIIIKSGLDLLGQTLNEILGARISPELSRDIKNTLISNDQVYGAYDLLLHDYGPEKYHGSVHIEVDDSLNADEIDDLSRKLTRKVYNEHGVILEAIGIYAVNTSNPVILDMHRKIMNVIHSHDYVIQTHGFHVDFDPNIIYIDVIIDFSAPYRTELYEQIRSEIQDHMYLIYSLNMLSACLSYEIFPPLF